MSAMVSQIKYHSTVCWTACSCLQQSNHHGYILLALYDGNPPVTNGFALQIVSRQIAWVCSAFAITFFEIPNRPCFIWPRIDYVDDPSQYQVAMPSYQGSGNVVLARECALYIEANMKFSRDFIFFKICFRNRLWCNVADQRSIQGYIVPFVFLNFYYF